MIGFPRANNGDVQKVSAESVTCDSFRMKFRMFLSDGDAARIMRKLFETTRKDIDL